MATQLQDLQAKRKELQATNPNATMLDARTALNPAQVSPIANAPVAWQAPAITPTPITPNTPTSSVHDNASYQSKTTEQYNQWVLEKNKAKVAWQIQAWTRPEVWQQATPAQVPEIVKQVEAQKIAPVEAPVTPTPTQSTQQTQVNTTPTQAPTTPKAETTKADWTITAWDKMPWNIEYKSGDKAIPPAPTAQGLFNALYQKADVPDEIKATPAYKIAQNRYTKANMYASMTPAQLGQDMKEWKIVEWSPAWEDLKMINPKLAKDTQNLNTVNGTKPTIFTYVNNPDGTKTKQNNLVNTFVSDYEDNYGDIMSVLRGIYGWDTAEEAKAKIYTPDVRMAEDKASQIELDMNKIDDTINQVDEDVESEFRGTWATGSRIALEKAYRKEKLGNQYNSLLKQYTAYANKANNLITQNTDLYKTEQAQKQQMQQALAWVAMKQYDTQLGLQSKLAEYQMGEELARQAQNDPVKAVTAMVEEYKKQGIPFTRSTLEMIQEAQNYVANGGKLADYLTNLNQTVQSKPEYKRMLELQQGQMTDMEKMQAQYWQQLKLWEIGFNQDIAKLQLQYDMNSQKWITDFRRDLISKWMPPEQADAIVRNETWNWNWSTWKSLLYADDGTFIPSTLKETTNPYGWIECSEYLSKMTGSKVGNTWEEKVKLNNETTGWVGSIAIWKPNEWWAFGKYWHAWIIVWEEWDNYLIKSANYNGDGRISTDTVPKSEIKWYRSTALWGWETKEPLTDKQFTQSNQIITSFKSDPQVKAFEEAYSQWMSLISSLNDKTWPWDVAAIFQFMKTLDPASVVRESEFEVAAKSAWVTEYIGNTWDRITQGKKLTDSQAEAFWKLAKQFVVDKSKLYDTKYKDWLRRLEKQWIDTSVFPESTASQMRQTLWVWEEWPVDQIKQALNNLTPDAFKKYF